MRLERSGDGDTCVEGKKQEKKKKKRKGKVEETYGCKEWKEGNNNKIKKSQLNVTIIFSQYFTINFK